MGAGAGTGTTVMIGRFSSPGTVLYVLPHADDELFAAGLMLALRGETQSLVWLTTGGWLAGLRRTEQDRAADWLAGSLGIASERLSFPDGNLSAHHEDAVRILRERFPSPATVVTTALEGRHPDHDAAARISSAAFPAASVIGVPCYDRGLGRRRVGRPVDATSARWCVSAMGPPLRRTRLQIVRLYRSQWGVLWPLVAAGGRPFMDAQWWSEEATA